ncbi:hypothetical protein HBH56_158080 [Parastagonospora nodorum]|uniref:Uncharacterized protein n=1 Tax=Phaeosphaeria nodorum (strain SN15 / ATCC MYA-4574 / FGSC 10173) TaxID=321614 RepID=A0A7U2I2H1_PHANO|nr:hypothetical protein HBH56_158080 [Parastagonospora nodorum]QRC97411.1 hypothetical protein JI435_434910 [Parastagonospora nodorum SN15]KAH3973506.1 hypothetical protein HBH51_097040 [Parastagonospora nodorum]KAH4017991.1 hypothetical protein HBI13_137760 [Parastagonospora nodorum]KAH4064603.1 hypothetical protein HBH50_173140 [Parastagonospora nodorum]
MCRHQVFGGTLLGLNQFDFQVSKNVARRSSSTTPDDLFLDIRDLDLELLVLVDAKIMGGNQSLFFNRDRNAEKGVGEEMSELSEARD